MNVRINILDFKYMLKTSSDLLKYLLFNSFHQDSYLINVIIVIVLRIAHCAFIIIHLFISNFILITLRHHRQLFIFYLILSLSKNVKRFKQVIFSFVLMKIIEMRILK